MLFSLLKDRLVISFEYKFGNNIELLKNLYSKLITSLSFDKEKSIIKHQVYVKIMYIYM